MISLPETLLDHMSRSMLQRVTEVYGLECEDRRVLDDLRGAIRSSGLDADELLQGLLRTDIQQLLEQFQLSKTGNKDELIDRLLSEISPSKSRSPTKARIQESSEKDIDQLGALLKKGYEHDLFLPSTWGTSYCGACGKTHRKLWHETTDGSFRFYACLLDGRRMVVRMDDEFSFVSFAEFDKLTDFSRAVAPKIKLDGPAAPSPGGDRVNSQSIEPSASLQQAMMRFWETAQKHGGIVARSCEIQLSPLPPWISANFDLNKLMEEYKAKK